MEIFGVTPEQYERERLKLLKTLRQIGWFFGAAIILPFLLTFLFRFGVLKSTPVFSEDIQQPVAKIITPSGTGTGFLISPTKLLTAAHVLEGLSVGSEVDVIFERKEGVIPLKGIINYIAPNTIGKNAEGNYPIEYFINDFAVISLRSATDIQPLFVGESDIVNLLDEVILIGYPSGDFSITKGNINSDKINDLDLFKLDAPSNPGNSGGPCILKLDNSVIGLLVGGKSGAQGENIAVKISDIKNKLAVAKIDIVE